MIRLALMTTLLTGCSLIGSGNEASSLGVKNVCKVDLSQVARSDGMDDTDVIEDVRVKPDCSVDIKFRSLTGDSVREIEDGNVTFGQNTKPVEPLPPAEKDGNDDSD